MSILSQLFSKNKNKQEWERIVKTYDLGEEGADLQLKKLKLTPTQMQSVRYNLYNEKANQGDAYSQYWMGLLYLYGTELDLNKSKMLLEKSATQNYVPAITTLARQYSKAVNECCVTFGYDLSKEFYWKLKAAELNDVESQLQISEMYERGFGTDVDLETSKYWKTRYLNLSK